MTPAEIVLQTAHEVGVTVEAMKSARRWARLVVARRLAAERLLAAGLCYRDIGRALGGKDHTGVMYLLGAIKGKQPSSRTVFRQVLVTEADQPSQPVSGCSSPPTFTAISDRMLSNAPGVPTKCT